MAASSGGQTRYSSRDQRARASEEPRTHWLVSLLLLRYALATHDCSEVGRECMNRTLSFPQSSQGESDASSGHQTWRGQRQGRITMACARALKARSKKSRLPRGWMCMEDIRARATGPHES
ncbi:hypothetical protein IE81DRAFT_24332 [Ceraceosorus guamensis]|uniref:Uncharacterized protein n=1 Tax=Ceraceosorus guamensis TaxID=1522189 RepID=A0A316VQG1_9BASI|nr:hypothetical protein IE81DRAFT_24332 [Ceraceosorus guamensis]PWN39484.1 hypothetical protein IE81DRAFT_24332 [Ceraceosorus guamensis]